MPALRAKFFNILAPALCVGMLGGAFYVQRDWPQRGDAEPYHARAREAVQAIPLRMGHWVGQERTPQAAAIQVLKPNAIRNVELIDPRVKSLRRAEQRVSLSVVQCKQFTNMLGHYPPNCYKNFGHTLTRQAVRSWAVPVAPNARPLTIGGMEYQFERVIDGRTYRLIVYNFMVAPKRGILPDMKALEKAAEDYEQRYFGAAQFQVVFDSLAGQELNAAERDEVFSTLMRHAAPAIEVLQDQGDAGPDAGSSRGMTIAQALPSGARE